jgi:hypothetical protein
MPTPFTMFRSFDKLEFKTEEACRAHEKSVAHLRIVGLTIEQVEAAMSGADMDLAFAIEFVGLRLRRRRTDARILKHQRRSPNAPKPDEDAEPGNGQSPEDRAAAIKASADAFMEGVNRAAADAEADRAREAAK